MIGHVLEARVVAHVRGDLVAVHARHLDVEQDDVGDVVLQQRHRVHAVARGHDAHAVALEQALRHAAHGDRVVHHHGEGAAVALLARWRRSCGARAPLGAHQRADVENDDDAAVAEDGGAGDAADAGDLRTDRLHHDLAAADQLVRHQAGGVLAGAHQHHRDGDVLAGQLGGRQADEVGEVLEAVLLAAVVERGRVLAEVRRSPRPWTGAARPPPSAAAARSTPRRCAPRARARWRA